jgi:hypothetical protein
MTSKELFDQIEAEYNEFKNLALKFFEGNKSAGAQARTISTRKLQVSFKDWRAATIQETKEMGTTPRKKKEVESAAPAV